MSRKMKDSGIEWIGEIPEDWDVSTLGKVSSIQTGNTPSMQGNENYYIDGSLLWVKPDNLKSFIPIKDTKEKINELGYNRARIVKPNTPLICCIGSIGKFGYSEEEVAYNQQINAVEFDENIIQWKYGLYYLSTQEEQHWYYSTGNVVQILNTQNQKIVSIPIPNVYEQQKIANFLDEKVAEIDNLLGKTRESIEEYKNYKQSIITEAVTKGLNKNVAMKDSGVDWIGEIPEHWETRKLKYNVSTTKGFAFKQEMFSTEGVPVVKASDMKKGTILNSKVCIPYSLSNKYKTVELFTGDILMTTVGSTPEVINSAVGQIAKVPNILNNSLLNQNIVRIRTDNMLNNEYLFYLLNTHAFRKYLDLNAHGTANQASLSLKDILDYFITLPAIIEQKEIANYLENKCITIDSLINQKERLRLDLETYKKSLIYECVTGKREVV